MINLQKNEEQLTNEVMSKINLSKDKEKLGNHVVNLSKCVVNLSKRAEVDLGAVKARVVVVVDYSWSMEKLYNNGTVQEALNKLVPLGLTFDDNGELDVYLFETNYKKFDNMTIENYENYVTKNILNSSYSMGGTRYAPVLKAIYNGMDTTKKKGFLSGLFGKKSENTDEDELTFVIFITDGDNTDEIDTDDIVRKLSYKNKFIQFIGIGNEGFKYLKKLDDLDGRACDNTGFCRMKDLNSVNDTELYTNVLEQFADWLKVKGLN